jgi:hypothetical protein
VTLGCRGQARVLERRRRPVAPILLASAFVLLTTLVGSVGVGRALERRKGGEPSNGIETIYSAQRQRPDWKDWVREHRLVFWQEAGGDCSSEIRWYCACGATGQRHWAGELPKIVPHCGTAETLWPRAVSASTHASLVAYADAVISTENESLRVRTLEDGATVVCAWIATGEVLWQTNPVVAVKRWSPVFRGAPVVQSVLIHDGYVQLIVGDEASATIDLATGVVGPSSWSEDAIEHRIEVSRPHDWDDARPGWYAWYCRCGAQGEVHPTSHRCLVTHCGITEEYVFLPSGEAPTGR